MEYMLDAIIICILKLISIYYLTVKKVKTPDYI